MRKLEEEKRREKEEDSFVRPRLYPLTYPLALWLGWMEWDGMRSREMGDFSTPLKYGITLEIIARHWRSMLGVGNLISR